MTSHEQNGGQSPQQGGQNDHADRIALECAGQQGFRTRCLQTGHSQHREQNKRGGAQQCLDCENKGRGKGGPVKHGDHSKDQGRGAPRREKPAFERGGDVGKGGVSHDHAPCIGRCCLHNTLSVKMWKGP